MFEVPDQRIVDCCNRVTSEIIGAAIEVHRHLGSGVLESDYEDCLTWELQLRGISFQRQLFCPIEYKGHRTEHAYRLDLLVEGSGLIRGDVDWKGASAPLLLCSSGANAPFQSITDAGALVTSR